MRFLPSEITLQAFELVTSPWPGASYAVGTIPAAPGFNYAFVIPCVPQSSTFVPVIRYNSGTTYFRRKLWTLGTEIIPFGLYSGELIYNSLNPVLEIWTVQGQLTATMPATWYMTINPLKTPTSISDVTPAYF